MSKRLRASMRAANKGRNLRPRSSQLPPEPVEAEQQAADERESDSPEPVATAPSPAADSADLRARETVREPAVAAEPEREEEPEAAPIALVAKPEPAKEPEPEPAKEPEALSTRTQPSVASPVVKAEEVKEATKAEVPAPEASFKAEEPKKAEPVKAAEEPKKAEAPKKVEEPKKAEPVKAAEAPKKVEEPKKAAEPAKAAKVEPAKKVEEPKKAQPARAEEPKKAAKVEPAKKGKGKDAEAESRRPAALRAVEEDHDLSSISAEFFRKDEDSVPPVEELEEELGAKPVVVLSPTTLARRARLRRLVAGVVSFAGVISIAVVGKTVFASKRPPQPSSITVIETKHDEVKTPVKVDKPALDAPKPIETAKPEPEAKKDEPAKPAETAKPEAEAKKDEPAKVDEKKDEAKKEDAPKPTGDAAALAKEAESLLNRGKRADSMEKAREAIAADPTQAMPYLLLGSALQDSGKWKDGIEAYSECVRNATKGPVNECRAMGGHK